MNQPIGYRFLRAYHFEQGRMVNLWQEVMTEAEWDSCPQALEICCQARTIEGVLEALSKIDSRQLSSVDLIKTAKACMSEMKQVKPDLYLHR